MSPLLSVLHRIVTLRTPEERKEDILSGFNCLDDILGGFKNGKLYVVAGEPLRGKTAFMVSLVINMINSNELIRPGIISLDWSAQLLMERMISNATGISLEKIIRGRVEEFEYEKLLYGEEINKLDKAIIEDSGFMTTAFIAETCKNLVWKKGVKIIFIDYLQLITGNKFKSKEYNFSRMAQKLKKLADELQVPIVINVQLKPSFQNRMPQLSDLRKAGAVEHSADVILFLYRPQYYTTIKNETIIRVAKNNSGPVETIRLKSNLHIQRFEEFDKTE